MIIHDNQSSGWSHLLSTLYGEDGHKELMEFADKIGLDPRWIQKEGQHDEHFDLKGGMYLAARDNGSTLVSQTILVQSIHDKRDHARIIDST